MTAATPGQAERDYAEFSAWWQAKGYPDGMSLDFSDARDAFASGMRAARAIAAQEPHAAPVVTVDALAAALAARRIVVKDGNATETRTIASPRAVAVQLLSAIGMRPTDDPQ